MTLNPIAANVGIVKKPRVKAAKAKTSETSLNFREYLSDAIEAVKNNDFVQIDRVNYKKQIKDLAKRSKR